jgi:hypothetical protein
VMCPECGNDNVRVVEYDFGRCPETGYHMPAREVCACTGATARRATQSGCAFPNRTFRYFRANTSGALNGGNVFASVGKIPGRRSGHRRPFAPHGSAGTTKEPAATRRTQATGGEGRRTQAVDAESATDHERAILQEGTIERERATGPRAPKPEASQ